MRTLRRTGSNSEQGERARAVLSIGGARAAAIGALAFACIMSGFGTGAITVDRAADATAPGGDALALAAIAPAAVPAADSSPRASGLRLRGVVHGRQSVADIDGRIVRSGQTFAAGGGEYTVRAISGKSVTLADAAGEEFVLWVGGRNRALQH